MIECKSDSKTPIRDIPFRENLVVQHLHADCFVPVESENDASYSFIMATFKLPSPYETKPRMIVE